MAQFCIEIADTDVNRVVTAVCKNYGYKSTIDNPSYDPTIPEDPSTNPSTITNPLHSNLWKLCLELGTAAKDFLVPLRDLPQREVGNIQCIADVQI